MPSYPFLASALLVFLVFCALCGVASAQPANKSAKLFGLGSIDVLEPKGGGEERLNVEDFALPSLVGTGDVMVALFNVKHFGDRRGILTKYIGTGGDRWGRRAIEDNAINWKVQLALKSEKAKHAAFAPLERNNSIYILSASEAQSAPPSPQRTTNPKAWDFKLTIGTITDAADATGKRIEWDTQNVSDRFVTDIQDKLQDLLPYDGSAFLMEDGTFVFVLRAWNHARGKFFFVIAHSRDPGSDFTFNFVDTTAAHCYSDFFSWGEQLFMAPVDCFGSDSSDYKLRASNDMGETWREATGPLAESVNNMTKRSGSFTRITIEGRRVLLFTKEESASDASQGNVNISLFMADENYVERVGPIFTNVAVFYRGSLLYTNDELFFSNIQVEDFRINIIIARLKEQLYRIKYVLSVSYPDDM